MKFFHIKPKLAISKKDVAKFGYKKNRRVEKLGVLLHFGDLLSKSCGFLGRDLEICQFFCNFIAS